RPLSPPLFPYTTLFRSTADPLLLVLGRVVNRGAGRQLSRVDAQEHELADVLIVHDLEGERRKRLVVGGLAHLGLARLRVDALHGDRKSTRLNSSHGSSS